MRWRAQSSAFRLTIRSGTLSNAAPAPRSSSAIAARVSAFGTLISKGNVFSAATRTSRSRIASETDRPISARALAAFSLTCPSMRARTTVSEAIEPLLDVEDHNVATHHHSVYRTTFTRGLGCEDLLAAYRVLKPSSGDA